jgi:protein N-terminal asparagine amidohydrolase
VGQGEVAHAVSSQCDVLVTDRATTCHMLALRSESQDRIPLTSMAHIDTTAYESCIRSMVLEHLEHHTTRSGVQEEKKDDFDFSNDSRISLKLHLVGGFEDSEGCSFKISDWLLRHFSVLAREFQDSIKMSLETCSISSMNDNGYSAPIGRGLAIDLRTGVAFLANVDHGLTGPVPELRAIRNWSDESSLSIIHTSRSQFIEIHPFSYTPLQETQQLINLPDELLLQYTSTSPDAEEEGFCETVRASLRFLLVTPCSKVFSSTIQPLVFQRSGSSNNWRSSS